MFGGFWSKHLSGIRSLARTLIAIAVILFALTSACLYLLHDAVRKQDTAYANLVEYIEIGHGLMNVSDYLTGEVQAYTQFGDPVHYRNYWEEVRERQRREEFVDRLGRLNPPPAAMAMLEDAKQRSDNLVEIEEAAMEAVARGDFETARRLVFDAEYGRHKTGIRNSIAGFQEVINTHAAELVREAGLRKDLFILLMTVVILLFGSVVLASLYWFLVRRIAAPIEKVNAAMGSLAGGDIDTRLNIDDGPGEIADLAQSFEQFREHIAQRMEAQRVIEQSKRRLQEITDAMPGTVFQIEEAEGEPPRFTFISEGIGELFGVEREAALADFNAAFRNVADEDRKALRASIRAAAVARQSWSHEFRVRLRDGTERWIQTGQVPRSRGDGRVIWNGFWIDTTERKRMEQAIQDARERAEAATQAKANFLATMSHEIRTPMNGVVGMIDLLMHSELSTEQRQMANTIKDSAFALLTIINDILDFSKIESGKLTIERIQISLRDAVEGVADTLRTNAAKKKIWFMSFIDPQIPNRVLGDQVRVRQILFNLTGNAIKFTENTDRRRGRVHLRAELKGREDGRAVVRFSIKDNGIGMSEQALAGLFQPFTQAEQSTTRRFGGTGLGLSICKFLTDMMGGTIEVQSRENEGSTFSVELPFEVHEYQEDSVEREELSGLKVMVISEDPDETAALRCYLEHWHAEVTTAGVDDAVDEVRRAWEAGAPYDIAVKGEVVGFNRAIKLLDGIREHQHDHRPRFVLLDPNPIGRGTGPAQDYVIVESNPMRRSAFLYTVAVAAGRASPETFDAEQHHEETLEEAATAGRFRLLVAEDNPTNQEVIRRQLNLLGYRCEVVENGALAYQAWESGEFDLLLTDCHMPEMDGYELAQAIRAAEQGTDERVPIIAITANALRGEAETCLAAGMDDYLPKPLEMRKLKQTLRKWTTRLAASRQGGAQPAPEIELPADAAPAAAPAPGRDGDPIDPSVLREVFGDDDDTFREILKDFAASSRDIAADLDAGRDGRDAAQVAAAAHKLKSAARAVGANMLADLCQQLELAGKSADWDAIESTGAHFGAAMDGVSGYIERLLSGTDAGR